MATEQGRETLILVIVVCVVGLGLANLTRFVIVPRFFKWVDGGQPSEEKSGSVSAHKI